MPDFPLSVSLVNQNNIGTHSPESIWPSLTATVSSFTSSIAWPSANLAIYIPVEIYQPVTIVKMMVVNGTVVSGNIDVGIYDSDGNKRVSAGTTAQAGVSAIQIFDVTDTLLLPGLYYMAAALNNTTGTLLGWTTVVADTLPIGVFQQATAFVLPSPATFAAIAFTMVPWISMTTKTTI